MSKVASSPNTELPEFDSTVVERKLTPWNVIAPSTLMVLLTCKLEAVIVFACKEADG